MHCSTGQGKTRTPLFSAAVRIRLTAALRHCKYTYGDLLFIQLYSDATRMHCSTGLHWCFITVQLYEEQLSLGVFAVTQGCCQPDSHSSTEQWGAYFALTSAAVHSCCITV